MKLSKSISRTSKKLMKKTGDRNIKYCVLILVAIIIGIGISNMNINFQSAWWMPNTTIESTITQTNPYTPPTSTTTTSPTTTTTPPATAIYECKVMWDYQPKMQIDRPTLYVDLQENDPLGNPIYSFTLTSEFVWYYSSNVGLAEGYTVRLYAGDNGYIFNGISTPGQHYVLVTAGPTGNSWNLYSDTEVWGVLYFEWIAV